MIEEWRDIEGYEGYYKVSDLGRVMSLSRDVKYKARNKAQSLRKIKERILKGVPDKDGYLLVQLSKDGKSKHFKTHRLVADAFLEKIEGKDFVNHKNGIKTDNRLKNLEWCSNKENLIHAHHVLYKTEHIYYNEKICAQYDLNGNFIKIHKNVSVAAKEMCCTKNAISGCCLGKSKTAKGYMWRFTNKKENIEPLKKNNKTTNKQVVNLANELYHNGKNKTYRQALKQAWMIIKNNSK